MGENDPAIALAAVRNHLQVVELLIAHGAEIDMLKTDFGTTALGAATWYNHHKIVRLLLENGADPNQHSDFNMGHAPMHWAFVQGGTESAKALLESGADVNILTNRGATPLMITISNDDPSDIRIGVPFLINHGADPNIQDKLGNTALHFAAVNNSREVIEMLLEAGALIDAQNVLGDTALHRAAQEYAIDGVEVLIDHGASLDIENNEGETALDAAKNDAIRELLLAAGAEE